jgi:predicted nucleic acid-binding protein
MLYAESSAVIAWLLGEARGRDVSAMVRREPVVTSALTLLECDRVIHRAVARGLLSGADAAARRTRLQMDTAEWAIAPITLGVVDRARASFPNDAVRSLDAIHLATAIVVGAAVGRVTVLSLDERVRANAAALGFGVVPD